MEPLPSWPIKCEIIFNGWFLYKYNNESKIKNNLTDLEEVSDFSLIKTEVLELSNGLIEFK